ncbi:hybrid sensor histidine kinase/response regulator [Massilia sp. CCM 8734]|uniref:hybrid sensor histidine kinase/response regulator n=1 Tax=Massilia sp. CCM 8734 TaxID=2609283 RepID=UPI001421D69F|nr:hybrid sensor histidine kinase/response regulator [Massilia sp. CCM 8734]NHZ96394.1 response regulator [Massilia sp. CCM 8734]
MSTGGLGDMSVYELFRLELDSQAPLLVNALLALEADALPLDQLKTCMRCAHSLKGAARMINLGAAVSVTHAMEEMMVRAQAGDIVLRTPQVDALLAGADLLRRIAYTPEGEMEGWTDSQAPQALAYIELLAASAHAVHDAAPAPKAVSDAPRSEGGAGAPPDQGSERMLRVTAENLNVMFGLAGETLVASRWLKPFAASLAHLKRLLTESERSIAALGQLLSDGGSGESAAGALAEVRHNALAAQQFLALRVAELERFSWRESELAQRMYDAALASRMRPFGDGVDAFPRMVRDLAQSLGKQVRLKIIGHATLVDRDILERIEAPLTHLLRNAVDHGIEPAASRRAAGKNPEAVIELTAGHSAGMLLLTVSDDGRGIDPEPLRRCVVERQLTNAATAAALSDSELLEFLFLPGFTMKDEVDEISGRGVGLDVVQHMARQLRGSVRIETRAGKGTTFRLVLPLTTSVVRSLLVAVDSQLYAFPLAQINRTLMLRMEDVEQTEGHQHFRHDGRQVGLVTAHQVLGVPVPQFQDAAPVIVLGDGARPYGVVVDRLLGEHELVVQALDGRLGKVKDISAGAVAEDGSPVLIIDVEDMLLSIDRLVVAGPLLRAHRNGGGATAARRKRVLVVDDSFTVRELERKLLQSHGYEVDVAVDGMDGWNAARTGSYDLIVTDVDMPRMDGIELITMIKQHPQLRTTPVLIVSYKDRPEDQRRGLDAGADYYLTKSSFHDDSLVEAVADLIGEAAR